MRCLHVLALVLCLLLPAGKGMAQACRLPTPIDDVAEELALMNWARPDFIASRQVQIRALAQRIQPGALAARMDSLGAGRGADPVHALLRQAEAVGRTGRLTDPGGLQATLRNVRYLDPAVCTMLREALGGPGLYGRLEGSLLGSLAVWFNDAQDPSQISPLRAVLAVPMLIMAVCFAIVLTWAMNWAIAFFHTRKACRVPAILHIGDHALPGWVILVSRNKCRFQPEARADLEHFRHLAETADTCVDVAGISIPAYTHGVYSLFGALYFTNRISREQLRRILSRSVIAPVYVRRDTPAANVRRRT